MKKFLHVGCGPAKKEDTTFGFSSPDWEEIRFDIDPDANPHIVGTMVDMKNVESRSMDAIFSSHNIEHVYPHEVEIVLREFLRVLNDDGFVVITCPDLQTVCEAVVADKLLDTLYESGAGPITPIDIIYGHRGFIQEGNTYMAHKCGFTYSVLSSCLMRAGFKSVIGGRRRDHFDLWIMGYKNEQSESLMNENVALHLP